MASTLERDKTLDSLVRSLGLPEVSFLLREKYKVEAADGVSVRSLSDMVLGHANRQQITAELDEIRTLATGIDYPSFREMAIEAGVQPHATDSTKLMVLRVFIKDSSTAELLSMMAQAVNQVGFDEVPGRPGNEPSCSSETEDLDLLQATVKELINTDIRGQKCIVKVRKVRDRVLMVAYLEQHQRKIYQAGEGDRIAVSVINPLAKTTAMYHPSTNRLRIHSGNNKRIQKRIAESFGRALFKDNEYFAAPGERNVYTLSPLAQGNGSLELIPAEFPDVTGIRVVEEKFAIDAPGQPAIITIEASNVEPLLPYLSNEKVNWTRAERISATFEFDVAHSENKPIPGRAGKPRVTIVKGHRINYDPRYETLVHAFLKKWGMES